MQGEGKAGPPQEAWRWPLAGVVFATAVPILLFATFAAVLIVQHSRANIEHVATARALVAAVDAYMLGQPSAARVVAEQRGTGLAVVISDADGALNTVAFEATAGAAGPLVVTEAIRAGATQAAQTIEPVVHRQNGDIPVSDLPLRTPIIRDGHVTGVVSTRAAFTGHIASPSVVTDLAGGGNQGVFINTTLEGERYLRPFETSPLIGWHVAVGASHASILRTMQETFSFRVALAGAAALVLSVIAALVTGAGFGRRIIARERQMSAAMRTSEARYRAVVEASQQLVWTCRADGSACEDSPTWRTYTGQTFERMRGFGWLEAIHPDDREPALARWRTSQAGSYEAEYRLFHRASGRHRWVLARARPLRADNERVLGWIGMSIDIDERKTIEERQQLLMREVDHRAKNALTVAQAVVQMTRADDIDSFVAAVVGRIAALVRAHALLACNRWEGSPLRRLVEAALMPFAGGRPGEGDRIRIAGPEVCIAPESVQPLAMLLYELVTNAAKYGSLSRRAGSVSVVWTYVEGRGGLRLTWRESGGPPVAPPVQAGFGSTLVRNLAERQLDGTIRFEWHPRGLHCALELPSTCVSCSSARPGAPAGPRSRPERGVEAQAASRAASAASKAPVIAAGGKTSSLT